MKHLFILAALTLAGCASHPDSSSLPHVSFEVGSSSISDSEEESIKLILEGIESKGHDTIILSGHADNRGGDAYNRDLSLLRANSVKNKLREHGFEGSVIHTGLGESQSFCEDIDCDRRVTIDSK